MLHTRLDLMISLVQSILVHRSNASSSVMRGSTVSVRAEPFTIMFTSTRRLDPACVASFPIILMVPSQFIDFTRSAADAPSSDIP
jgi:hypothetical protein